MNKFYKKIAVYSEFIFCSTVSFYLRLRGLPGMASKDIAILKEIFKSFKGKKINVLEWGTGISTVYYSRFLRSIGIAYGWYGIDNSPEWHKKILYQIKRNNLNKNVHLYLFDFKPFWKKPNWKWGVLEPRGFDPKEENEIKYITSPASLNIKFDIIIVDGRFRRRCLLETEKLLSSGGVVILHDAQKQQYHSSLGIYKSGRFIDSGYLYYFGSRSKCKMWTGSNDNPRA